MSTGGEDHAAAPGSRRLEAADQLGVITNHVARIVNAHARRLLAGTGVDASAMRIMAEIVANSGALRPGQLATLLHVDLSTVSRQIRAAETAGFLDVVPDPRDRRTNLVDLTEQGRRAYHHVRTRRAELLAGLFEGLDDNDIHQLLTQLNALANVAAPPAPI